MGKWNQFLNRHLVGANWLRATFNLVKWLSISVTLGILTGTSSAALLGVLDWATKSRETHSLLLLLPVGGLVSGLMYHYLGKSVEAGNNLILEEIHDPNQVIPWQMAPLVLVGTTIAHIVGASAGREGTAVQMGVAIVDRLTQLLRLDAGDRKMLLMAGISGGIASVFGTPLGGMVFGLEVLTVGSFRHNGIFPCLMTAIIGDRITLAWGLHRQVYRVPIVPPLTIWGILTAIVAGIAFGLTAWVFATLSHQISDYFKTKISYPPLRPLIGGGLVAIAIQLVGTTKYIGLGIPTIVSAFQTQLSPWDFLAKIGFTTLSLG
ncbi:MAG: chloride channel protein [Chamaesiphon sp.]|nr:chloride channel protein [Chamaesiphon sp.]